MKTKYILSILLLTILITFSSLNAEEKHLTQTASRYCRGAEYPLHVEAVYYQPKNELQVTISNSRLVNSRDLELKDAYIYVYNGPVLIGEKKLGKLKLKVNESKTYKIKIKNDYRLENVSVVVKGSFESVMGLGPLEVGIENATACGRDNVIIIN